MRSPCALPHPFTKPAPYRDTRTVRTETEAARFHAAQLIPHPDAHELGGGLNRTRLKAAMKCRFGIRPMARCIDQVTLCIYQSLPSGAQWQGDVQANF